MLLTINAWLDKDKPELSVIDAETGKVVANWRGKALRDLFTNGILTYQELAESNKLRIKRLAKFLLLQHACEELDKAN